jgi:hypothetical protein
VQDFVFDDQGKRVLAVEEGDLVDDEGAVVGTVRSRNVYDRHSRFVFHLLPIEGAETSGRMTAEAFGKLLHPKQPR